MKLFVGLGNPGAQYAFNRHNVGFMAVDAIAADYHFPPWRKRFTGVATEGKLGGETVLILKPGTYMNESGRSVGEALRFYKLELDDVVVFHDELDLAPGKVRVKTGGGAAGHNGLKSITAHIGNDYVRVRIGIGHPGRKDQVSGYVLHDFAKADHDWLEPLLGAIAEAAPHLADGANDKFQSLVAHRTQEEGDITHEPKTSPKPSPKTSPKTSPKPAAKPAKAAAPSKPAQPKAKDGPFGILRRWLGQDG